MIEVRDLRHVYNTKSKNKVLALKGVSCRFESQGMYFIVGKSGCGKSTFLNLLGGLDKISIGDVLVDGVSMKNFSQSDYDAYRASYVGIIFQEFNLLEELTVFENIELQLNIAGIRATNEMIEESLTKVGLSGYGERMPYELSGGERQRVAIARQLAKGAKLLLADEPTGNLDSSNAENVFEILKELSKEITVIVVSHDLDFAERYADKIITMKDGLIEGEKQLSAIDEKQEKSVYKSVKPRFPAKYVRKFAVKNVSKRKIRFAISLILSFIACAMFCILGSLVFVDAERSIADKLISDNAQFYHFIQGIQFEGGNINVEAGRDDFNYLNRYKIENKFVKNKDFLYQYKVQSGTQYYSVNTGKIPGGNYFWQKDSIVEISGAEDITNVLGYEMIGEYLPLDADSAYITDYLALGMIYAGETYLDGENKIALTEESKIEDLVGKTFVYETTSSSVGGAVQPGSNPNVANKTVNLLKINGIIKTDYEKYGFIERHKEIKAHIEANQNGQIFLEDEFDEEETAMKKLYCSLFLNADGVKKIVEKSLGFVLCRKGVTYSSNNNNRLFLEDDGFFINDKNYDVSLRKLSKSREYYFATQDGCVQLADSDFEIADDEVVLGHSDYETIFGESLNIFDYFDAETVTDVYTGQTQTVYKPNKNVPPRIGETITLFLDHKSVNKTIIKNLTVKGVLFNGDPGASSLPAFGVNLSKNTFTEFAMEANICVETVLMKKAETREQSFENVSFFSQFVAYPDTNYTQKVIFTQHTLNAMSVLFLLFGSAFLLVALLMFANYMSSVIRDNYKSIGIIRAIGGTSGSVFNVYSMLGVLFYLITFVLYIVVYLIAFPLLNGVFAKGVLVGVQFLYFSFITVFAVAGLMLLVMSLASLIPIIKVNKKSPMEAIRQL